MMLATKVLLKPVLTEKTHPLLKTNVYVFVVNPLANKTDVKTAFQTVFNVKVTKVNLTTRKRKPKTLGRYKGFKKQQKKAYITLARDQKLRFLSEAEADLTPQQKPEEKQKRWGFFPRFRSTRVADEKDKNNPSTKGVTDAS